MYDVASAIEPVTLAVAEDLQSGRTQRWAADLSPVLVLLIPCVEKLYNCHNSMRVSLQNVCAI